MFTDIAQLVLNHWNAEGLRPNEAPSTAYLAVQFRSIGLKANAEVLEVFSQLNGFDDEMMDGALYEFLVYRQDHSRKPTVV